MVTIFTLQKNKLKYRVFKELNLPKVKQLKSD